MTSPSKPQNKRLKFSETLIPKSTPPKTLIHTTNLNPRTTGLLQSCEKAKLNLKICAERVANSNSDIKLEHLLVEETWLEALPGELRKPYAKNLCLFVEREMRGSVPIYPPPHLVFNALNSTSFGTVKAVIIGQIVVSEKKDNKAELKVSVKVSVALVKCFQGDNELHNVASCFIDLLGMRYLTWKVLLLSVSGGLDNFLEILQYSLLDPYHEPGQAMGLSFSVPEGIKVPSSLCNIFKELKQDMGCSIPPHGNLEPWALQATKLPVIALHLWLNSVCETPNFVKLNMFAVRNHQANSHAKKGWEPFTDAVIRAISLSKSGVVFLLWGNYAQEKSRLIDESKHHILKAAHPSGLSANRGFFGCRHFSKTNQILERMGVAPIDWQL
ncbi:hypothetical protein GIB67_009140 [Kingdonia uniflora]|uniref:Uracil-DNA glycosylase n=1 Tax=Kingdonia uniflora TaxID=39325 RepID=A0A7J7N290_9MAGN|nr:hypothetical protein GIB67_009140 [Kingdonia uniflora]